MGEIGRGPARFARHFPDVLREHWPHLRTTNPIQSTFATVRLRTHRTKGAGSRIATLVKFPQRYQKSHRPVHLASLWAIRC